MLDGDRPAGDAAIATSIETIAAGFDTVRLGAYDGARGAWHEPLRAGLLG